MSLPITMLMTALGLLLIASIGFIIWRMISSRHFPLLFFLFLILPVGQMFMLYSFQFETWSMHWLLGVLLALLADVVLVLYAISQERKIAAEEELKDVRHIMELEKSHYATVQSRREQLSEIRNDFNKRLVLFMEHIGDDDASTQGAIAAMAEKINQTREHTYCGIPVINAILTEKAEECAEAGIGFEVSLDIPPRIVVSQMHLCSIFGNLLDNAISACNQAEHNNASTIHLSSMVDGDYLFIKATNPANRSDCKPADGRGYGFRILTDLAKRYGGDFFNQYDNGTFAAIVSLLAVASAEDFAHG